MAIHAKISSEAAAVLHAQKRNSTITALIIAILSLFLICLILFVIAMTVELKSPPEIISYSTGLNETEEIEKPKTESQIQRKPSAPSSSMAKVIASTTPVLSSVPTITSNVSEPSIEYGNGNDFGSGWGNSDDFGSGGGGGASFFNQKVNAKRICFVIDYSGSMKGKRIELLKAELSKSIENLPAVVDYQMIFFAGPAWVAGSDLQMQGRQNGIAKYEGKEYKWIGKGAFGWKTENERLPTPIWLKADSGNLENSLKIINETGLIYGTAWEAPLLMALKMKPKPNIIFFMTDGSSGGRSQEIAEEIAKKAKNDDIVINAVAMMDPNARDAMSALAQVTGGQFTMVDKEGNTIDLLKDEDKE